MLYLSELIGKRIVDRQGNTVARIRDLVAELVAPGEGATNNEALDDEGEPVEHDVPVIKGLVARTGRSRQPFFLPISQVQSLARDGARIRSLKVDLQPFERREGEMLLTRDLWDKQVIDLERRRVVRVNDIVIASATADANAPRWWVRGVDVGMGSLLRRVHLATAVGAVGGKAVQPHIVRWQHLDVFGSNVPGGVRLGHKKLANLHPVEIARITDSVSYHQGAEIIASLDDTLAADTLEEIEENRQTDIMEQIPEERAADILEEMAPDEATDLLGDLPEEKAGALLEEMDQEDAREVRQLLRYPENSAGGTMTTDFVCCTPNMTVGEVIEANKSVFLTADLIYYIHVVASQATKVLVGLITVRDLLVHVHDRKVGDFMLTDLLTVSPGENQRDVARKMAEYNLLALPVVDADNTLLGVVTVDDALDALLPEGWKKRLPRIFS
jgi:CBS domain-containing protein/sporulation protein YlmC with PRC-barrel domain